jgi:hypothetical protein
MQRASPKFPCPLNLSIRVLLVSAWAISWSVSALAQAGAGVPAQAAAGASWTKAPVSFRAPAAGAQSRATGFNLGVSFGEIGRTDTFDDGYQTGGNSSYLDATAGIVHPLAHALFWGADVHLVFPFQSATVQSTVTKLGTTGILEAMLGTPANLADRPINLWATFGGAVGAVQSGYASPSYSYSDTETLKGVSVSVGGSMPVVSHIAVTTEIRYTDLFSGSFSTPGGGGSYGMSERGVSGSVGLQYQFR